MIIIGEKINATRKAIAAALADRDEQRIITAATEQADAGADYIDVNGGDPREGQETKNMEWLVNLVLANTDRSVAVDSANPQAVEVGLALAGGGDRPKPILNSISLESERIEALMPMLEKHDCMVVGLLMSDDGAPTGADDRVERAAALIEKFRGAGKATGDIIIDPCFFPISADANCGRAVVDAIAAIRKQWPDVHVGGGCSNISFGLPRRRLINFALLAQAIYHGMDVGIIDPCIPGIIPAILAAEAVAGRDEFCMNYVTAERGGKLG